MAHSAKNEVADGHEFELKFLGSAVLESFTEDVRRSVMWRVNTGKRFCEVIGDVLKSGSVFCLRGCNMGHAFCLDELRAHLPLETPLDEDAEVMMVMNPKRHECGICHREFPCCCLIRESFGKWYISGWAYGEFRCGNCVAYFPGGHSFRKKINQNVFLPDPDAEW